MTNLRKKFSLFFPRQSPVEIASILKSYTSYTVTSVKSKEMATCRAIEVPQELVSLKYNNNLMLFISTMYSLKY